MELERLYSLINTFAALKRLQAPSLWAHCVLRRPLCSVVRDVADCGGLLFVPAAAPGLRPPAAAAWLAAAAAWWLLLHS